MLHGATVVPIATYEPCDACSTHVPVRFADPADPDRRLCRDCLRSAEAERRAAEQRRRHLREFLEQPGAEEHADSTLDTFVADPDRRALEAARAFVEDAASGGRPSLYLFSARRGEPIAPGSGKTHLAVGIARELIARGFTAAITRVNRLMLEVYRTFKREDADALDVVRRYTDPDVLVLDDLGTEKWNEYNLSVIYEILCSRAHKATVITSNYALGYLEKRDTTGYMPRITSRIAGTCRIVRLAGPDRRIARKVAAAPAADATPQQADDDEGSDGRMVPAP